MGQVAVTRREWAWSSAFAALVMALTSVPYLLGAASQTPERRFSGFVLGVADGNSYLAKMGQGARGAWLFTLPYSSEPQSGAPLFGFYLLLGRLAGPDHAARVLAFHLARVVFGFGLLLVSYRFLAEFLPDVRQRRLGLALVALGGGLGWLLVLFGLGRSFESLPVDFYSPEAFTFLILYALPHLALARSLWLLGLLAYWRGRGLWAGLALLAASFVQPLTVLIVWIVIGLDLALVLLPPKLRLLPHASPSWPRALPILLLSSPFFLYTAFLFTTDPLLKQWNTQNVLPSPHPVHYLFGYGVLTVLAVPGWRVLAGHRSALARFVLGWAIAIPFLLYLPLTTQRRLIEGFQLPLVALAVLGATEALRRFRWWVVALALGLTLPTTAVLLAGGAGAALTRAEPIFHPADQLAAFDWLAHNARPGEAALSAFETGNVLPAYTPLVAYIGHGPETVFLTQKAPRVAAFYRSSTGDAERRQLLADGRIAFVIFGPHERALGGFDPARADYLRARFAIGDYAVYEVVP